MCATSQTWAESRVCGTSGFREWSRDRCALRAEQDGAGVRDDCWGRQVSQEGDSKGLLRTEGLPGTRPAPPQGCVWFPSDPRHEE